MARLDYWGIVEENEDHLLQELCDGAISGAGRPCRSKGLRHRLAATAQHGKDNDLIGRAGLLLVSPAQTRFAWRSFAGSNTRTTRLTGRSGLAVSCRVKCGQDRDPAGCISDTTRCADLSFPRPKRGGPTTATGMPPSSVAARILQVVADSVVIVADARDTTRLFCRRAAIGAAPERQLREKHPGKDRVWLPGPGHTTDTNGHPIWITEVRTTSAKLWSRVRKRSTSLHDQLNQKVFAWDPARTQHIKPMLPPTRQASSIGTVFCSTTGSLGKIDRSARSRASLGHRERVFDSER